MAEEARGCGGEVVPWESSWDGAELDPRVIPDVSGGKGSSDKHVFPRPASTPGAQGCRHGSSGSSQLVALCLATRARPLALPPSGLAASLQLDDLVTSKRAGGVATV